MAALSGTIFQYSDLVKLDRTKQELWTTEPGFVDYSLMDSLGNRSRVLRVMVRNALNIRENYYSPMYRVRLLGDFGVVIFLGRIISIEPDYKNQLLILTCRDFLDDIADRTVEASNDNGILTGVTRSYIVDKIINGETYKPTVGGDINRALIRRLQLDRSPYTETLSRTYSQKGDFQTVSGSTPGSYVYRGVKTGMEAISELAREDPQQDLMAFYYTPTPTDPTTSNHINNPQQYPRTYWVDLTRELHDGSTFFVTPQTAQDTNTPESADILYFGSNSKFDGLRYTFVQRGTTIENGTYGGTIQWQYWNGTAWTNFTPTSDAKFGVDANKIYGTTSWTVTNLTNWGKRDLGTTPDMPTDNDADKSWTAPWASSGVTQPEDVTSDAISKVDHGDEHRNTNRYWIRVYARTGSITMGRISTVELNTKPTLFHDFRCEDPQYFAEVWKYTHNTATTGWTVGRDGPGGTWTALNMTGGNDGTGNRLLWDSNDQTINFINGNDETWYFGLEYPFNGVQFHAYQRKSPNYSNVKFVWQWYSSYYAGVSGEPWQTISGLTITSNTLANPTVVTTERHHLATGDTVVISGSNSSPVIDGTYTVTVISATTFSIPVNVTTAGTAGHVVINNHITDTEAMGNSGDASWKGDGAIYGSSDHYYLEVRWDTDNLLGTFSNDISQDEFDKFYPLDDYPYKDMVSGRSAKTMKFVSSVGANSISLANPTVITSADGAGGTTENHNLKTGDKVFIRGSDSTPSIDGIHTITKVDATTFTIPVNVTTAGTTASITAFTEPPSSRVLYWVRCFITSGTPTQVAPLRDVKTSNTGMFKYFDRGKEPWVYNANTTVQGTTATRTMQYCYRYDTSAAAGSKFTDFTEEIQSSTSGTALTITSNTVANPTVVTTSVDHGMLTGHSVVITGSNSTPSINGTHSITKISDTTFSIAVNVTAAGTAGTATPEKVIAFDSGQVNDAIYFGMDDPFTAVRLNISDVLSSSSGNQYGITWEFYQGGSTDNWTTITHFDETGDFTTSGTSEVTFDMPISWRAIQPGVKETNATDQAFGKTAYYVRARISAITGSPSGTAKLVQGLVGPNFWHPGLEVGTISGVTSTRHTNPKTYGITLSEFIGRGNQRITISAYELNDKPVEFVNKVSVRGYGGAYGTAEDTTSIDAYELVKERIIDDSTLINSLQCETRARAILAQLKPGATTSHRECKVKIRNSPIYSHLNKPRFLRAGDRVNVDIPTVSIADESWLVYSMYCHYIEDTGWECDLILFRDMSTVFESGAADKRIIRDLVTRSRETANAVFQPLDKAVRDGLDFLPEGPGRLVGREEYETIGTNLGITPTGQSTGSQDFPNDFRWTRKLYTQHKTREFLPKDLMRIEHLGINPENDGNATGGAGLTLIGRDKQGSGLADFHPANDEATIYLRTSTTLNEGTGLYLAHRGVFNSDSTYDEWVTDTPKLQAEVMTGFTGFVDVAQMDSSGRFNIVLPALDSVPLVFTSWCGHEEVSGQSTPNDFTGAICNPYRWTVDGNSKYTNVQMQVRMTRNSRRTWYSSTSGFFSWLAISGNTVANPTVVTTTLTHGMSNGDSAWIGNSNSTPNIDGIHTITYISTTTFSVPVNVTVAGTTGNLLPQKHVHHVSTGQFIDPTSSDTPNTNNTSWKDIGGGVMYLVLYNSGKNVAGLNSHFSQNHINHP